VTNRIHPAHVHLVYISPSMFIIVSVAYPACLARFFHPYVSEGNLRTIGVVSWMALAIIVPADLLRFRFKGFARTYGNLLGLFIRESEESERGARFTAMYMYHTPHDSSSAPDSVNSVVWYILGVNFVLCL